MADQGTLNFRILLDNGELKRQTQEAIAEFKKVSDTVKAESKAIDSVWKQTEAAMGKQIARNIQSMSNDAFGNLSAKAQQLAKDIQEDILALTQLEKIQRTLNDSYEAGGVSLDSYLTTQARLSVLHDELTNAIRTNEQALKSESASVGVAGDSIAGLQTRIALLTTEYMRLSQAQRNSAAGADLLKNLTETQVQLQGATASMNQYARQAGVSFNNLNFQVQQIIRELPTLAISPQMFFMAISNNIPMFADAVAKARKEFQGLNNEGKAGIPVWKQLVKSLLGWQAAIGIGVTLLTVFGGKIVDWVAGLFKGKKEVDSLAIAEENLNRVMEKGIQNAQQEITNLDLLCDVAKDTELSTDLRREAAEKLQALYPAYFGNMRAEEIMLGNTKAGYDALTASILATAKARSAEESLLNQAGMEWRLKNSGIIEKQEISKYLSSSKPDEFFAGGYDYIPYVKKARDLLRDQSINGYFNDLRGKLISGDFKEDKITEYFNNLREKLTGDDYEDYKIISSFIKNLEKEVDDGIKQIKEKDQELYGVLEQTGKNPVQALTTLQTNREELVAEIKKLMNQPLEEVVEGSVAYYDKEIQKLRKLQEQATTKEQYDDYEEQIKALEKQKAKIIGEDKKTTTQRAKLSDQLHDLLFKNEQEYQESTIALLKDGTKKELAELEARHQQEIAEIDKAREDIAKAYNEKAKTGVTEEEARLYQEGLASLNARQLNADKKYADDRYIILLNAYQAGVELQQQLSQVYMSEEEKRIADIKAKYDKLRNELNDRVLAGEFEGNEEDLRQTYRAIDIAENHELLADDLKQYETYQQQKARITASYNQTIAQLNAAGYAEQARLAEQQRDREIAQLELSQADFYQILFGNLERYSIDAIRQAVEQAQRFLDNYIAQVRSRNGGTLTAEDAEFIERTQRAIDEATDTTQERLPKGLREVSGMLREMADLAGQFDDSLGKSLETLGNMVGTLANVSAGIATFEQTIKDIGTAKKNSENGKLGFGDIIGFAGSFAGAIGSVVSGIASIFQIGSEAEKRHQEAIRKIMQSNLNFQREYNLLLLEQNLLYERGNTIFGDNKYGEAINAIGNYRDTQEQLNKTMRQSEKSGRKSVFEQLLGIDRYAGTLKSAYKGLADIRIKTGHEKTGLFGWGKGRDLYSSILDVYPQLIDKQGQFNTEVAQTILNTREMSDADRDALQNIVDLAEQAEEAMQSVKDYLTDIFGELGNTLTDALADAFKNGTDAAQVFSDSVSKMLENMAMQMAYSVMLAPLFEEAQDKMLEVMKNQYLSNEVKLLRYASITDDLWENIEATIPDIYDFLESAQNSGASHGFDLFKPDEGSRSATAQGIAQASQDSVDELNGRMTAVQGHTFTIAEQTKMLTTHTAQMLRHLAGIETHTAELARLENIESGIRRLDHNLESIAMGQRSIKIQ